MIISFLRYVFFSHQFYFLLMIFKADMNYFDAMAAISLMYLLTSVVPMLPLFDFLLKGSVAIVIFQLFNIPSLHVICIALVMWTLNFALPSILGSFFILSFRPIQDS